METAQIKMCDMSNCAYNTDDMCHTIGINVGAHAECNTYNHGSSKGGFPDTRTGVGSCFASDCRFNGLLECKVTNISVANHGRHADCKTFQPRS